MPDQPQPASSSPLVEATKNLGEWSRTVDSGSPSKSIEAAVAQERERCARIAEECIQQNIGRHAGEVAANIAAAIRRGE